jgi:hypothetical protein
MVDFMRRFSDRRGLRKKARLTFRGDGRARIYCDDPVVVARFVSEVRQEVEQRWPGGRVLLRGQPEDHAGMVPGIFREHRNVPDATLREAEACLENLLRGILPKNKRFQRPDLAALLQHYGVKTTWLDVVDDLRVASWFAMHRISDGRAEPRTGGSGWLYLLSSKSDAECLTVLDLRLVHHGLSLRPHVQQGWSLRGTGRDLNGHVVAAVEFPVNERWRLDGHMAQPAFLFPPAGLDDTLQRLSKAEVSGCLREAERRSGLAVGALGNVSVIV